jgi:hypothetical protein
MQGERELKVIIVMHARTKQRHLDHAELKGWPRGEGVSCRMHCFLLHWLARRTLKSADHFNSLADLAPWIRSRSTRFSTEGDPALSTWAMSSGVLGDQRGIALTSAPLARSYSADTSCPPWHACQKASLISFVVGGVESSKKSARRNIRPSAAACQSLV